MTNKPIHTANFTIGDDFTYLIENKKWMRRLSYRIGLEEEMKAKVMNALEMLIVDLENKPDKIDLIIEKILNKGAEHIYLIDIRLSELDFNQRREIEACFVASIIRYLILKTPVEKRDTNQAREEFRKRLVEDGVDNSYADFMQNEVGSDIELTCLYRFERAVLIAKTYISGNRNKGLFLSVGSLLEGSDDFTKYITGGHASKETKRRVAMIERLCGIQPRKRIRKLVPQNFPKEVPGPLLQFADVALSLETEDFSALGLIAQSKEHENFLYREYVGKKMATLNSVRIKVYNKDLDSLFDREVELLKKLNQRDCVVQMLGCFEVRNLIIYENSFHWRISNLVGAETLTIAYVWLDIMEAVYYVHSHGIVIRNLQPENIYLVGPVHNLRVKLADFSFAQKADVESIVTLNNQFTQVTGSKMGLDEIQVSALMTGGEKVRGFSPWKTEKLEIESRLDYALLKDFMFVAPEVFTKQAGFEADVWSLGLLILFLIKCMISWKEVRHVQEKAEEAEEECEKKMREMLDGLSWVSELSEDAKKEDTVLLGVLKKAIASCLHVSVKQRASLLEVRNNVQLAVNARKARGDIMLRKREIQHVQCLSSFMKCVKTVGEVLVFDKFQLAERIMYHESQAHSVVESSTLPLPPNKRTHVFLSHSWGVDQKLRNNHDRVVKVNRALRERGLVTWIDSESSTQMSGPVCQSLSDTLNSTCCVLVFITSNYEEKVNSSNGRDNCYFEFNVAAQNQNLANMRIPIVMEEIMLSQQRWRGRLKAEFGHQLYFDLSNSDDERVLGNQYDKIVERVVELLKERYPEVSFDNHFSGLSSDSSFSSPSIALASMILHSHKTLLNGRFTIINTFLRTADYECHVVHNNTSQRTQILKHIKVKNLQYENELLILRRLSNEVTISDVEDYMEDMYQKYVAVGWLEGGWLLNVLNDYQVAGQPMSEKCLQSIARGLVSAMTYLHGRGIIYRGLNLSRVLAKRVSEDEMIVKLWDFGPAMMKDGAVWTLSVGSGYPEGGEDEYYCMAPELLRNIVYIDHKQKYDERVDAWSVGMVLYLLVEGKSCFSVGDARSVLESIERWENGVIKSNRAVNTLSFRNDLVSQGTKDVITGLMNVLPNDRLSWTDEVLLRWSGLIKAEIFEPSLVVSSYLHSKVAPVRPPISHLNSLLHESAINYMSIDDHGCFPINPSGRLYSEPYQSNATIGIAYSNLPNSHPIKHQSPPMNFIGSPRSGTTMPFLRVSSGSSSTSYESDSDNESISSLIDKISLASPSLIPERIITILEEPVLKKKECYLKYFHYQEALKEDNLNKAEMILQELNRFDSDFTSEYEDIKTFHREYQRKFIEFEQVLNEWKVMVVMKNPKLFDEFKKCKIILEGLKKSNNPM